MTSSLWRFGAPAIAALAVAALVGEVGLLDAPARAKAPDAGTSYQVPYRLTDTNHFLVRVRINGKGPFNFLVDTGAPLLFVSTETAKKAGLTLPEGQVWAPIERFDFEGGASLTDVKGVVEDPFQLVGMNALGLPGASIDGILGYTILARFRIELDPTRDRMTWTRLDFEPRDPLTRAVRAGVKPAEVQAMDAMGPLAKIMAAFMGKQPEEKLEVRGRLGIELAEAAGAVAAVGVLAGSPAAEGGIQAGDVLVKLGGKAVSSLQAARAAVAQVKPGQAVPLTVRRGDQTLDLTLTAGQGL